MPGRQRLALEGTRYGMLTVVAFAGLNPTRNSRWLCRCDCGEERVHTGANLKRGNILSCGCRRRGPRVIDPVASHPDFSVYSAMLDRCNSANSRSYHRYGGRGIKLCRRWVEGGFRAFIADMGARPAGRHSIDRIDNNGGYWCGKAECPECGPLNRVPNCRWATPKQQQRNRNVNVRLTHNGETLTLVEWAEKLGIRYTTLKRRYETGKAVEDVLRPGRLPTPEACIRPGSKSPTAKITEDDVRAIRKRRASGETPKSLGAEYGIHPTSISHIVSRKQWKHVE